MANYMWLVATKNKEEFKDIDKLEKLIQEEFPEYLFRKGAHSDIPREEYFHLIYLEGRTSKFN